MVTKLTDVDFMMMDVHRPMTDEEVSETNSQALLDKSARPLKIVHSDAAGVGGASPYGYEQPLPSNVVVPDMETTHDLSTTEVLRNAFNANMSEMVICGIDENGNELVLRTNADLAPAIFHLTRAIHNLNQLHDDYKFRGTDNEPKRA